MTGKKNMYREVYRHTLMEEGAAVIIILALALILIFIKLGDLEKLGVSLEGRIYVCAGCAAAVLAVWLVSSVLVGAPARLRREIRNGGLDEQGISRDFQYGILHHAMCGVICIGNRYTIYASRGEAFVLPNECIRFVKRTHRTFVQKVNFSKMKTNHYGVAIYTDQGVRHIRSDESGVDRIVEGFRRRGIYENVIKDC